jgi:6-phosphogluconolactonase (cycloisomerase 2 family)
MKTKSSIRISVLITVLASLLATAGCIPGGLPDFNLVLPTVVDLQPAHPTIQVAKTQQFTIIVNGDQSKTADPSRFTWTSSQPAIATVSASGLATGVAPGTTTIKVVDKGDSSTFASTTLTVTAPAPAIREVAGGAQSIAFTVASSGEGFAYSVDAKANQLIAYATSDEGEPREIGAFPLPAGSEATWLAVDPSGLFLYVLSGATKSVSVFAIDTASGTLTESTRVTIGMRGFVPRSISVTADGKELVVEDAARSQATYRINQVDGGLLQ